MHYQVFLPGVTAADPQKLVDAGLEDHVENATFTEIAEGPTNERGSLVSWLQPGERFGFDAERQDWFPAVQRGDLKACRYHVGFWRDDPPLPTHLERPYQYEGDRVSLGDGNRWLMPRGGMIPQELALADDGTWRFERQRKFHALYQRIDAIRDLVAAEGAAAKIGFHEATELVLQALRLNYRLCHEAANRLKLFNTESVTTPLLTFCDIIPRAELN